MQYVDDPTDIYLDPGVVGHETEEFLLDDESCGPLPEPRLVTILADTILAHTLMVPYHNHSKFMVGVRGQGEWADEFINTD